MNWPSACGIVVSTRLATLHELETVYSVRDVFLMLEIDVVDNRNRRIMREAEQRV